MATFQGVISGIGNKANEINVISPQFDAKIRNFIVGKNCILSGLKIKLNTLTSGLCMACGYVGELQDDVDITNASYIYGHFLVYHNNQVPDKFEIVAVAGELTFTNADILHEAGEYYLLLYKNGEQQVDNNYPQNAVHSDRTDRVNEGGTLGENVTCPTQSVNDNSKKVANTEYVYNQIEEMINYTEKTINYTAPYGNSTTKIGEINLVKKAGYAVVAAKGTATSDYSSTDDVSLTFSIPTDFIPIEEAYLLVPFAQRKNLTSLAYLYLYKISTTGNASLVTFVTLANGSTAGTVPDNVLTAFQSTFVTGWKTIV